MSKLLPPVGGGKPHKPRKPRPGSGTNPFPGGGASLPTQPAIHPNVGGKAPRTHTSTSSYKKRG